MILNQILRFFGGMNKDRTIPDIKQGDTIDALNIRSITADGQTTGSVESIKGNEYVFNLGSTTRQNKKYVLTFYVETNTAYTFDLLDQNNNSLLVSPLAIPNNAYIADAAGYLAYVVAQINANLNGQTATITSQVVDPAVYGYVFIEVTTVLGRDYFIDTTITEVLQEAIDLSMVGDKQPIGSYDLLGDLFILSTPISNASQEIPIRIYNATPLQVVCTTPHGLASGDSVAISEVVGTVTANGKWIITVIDSLTFSLVGSSVGATYVSGGILTTYPYGYGELGVAQKNIGTGNWTYTRLLATRAWNLRTYFQAEVRAEIDGLRKSIYWTDNNDNYRGVYYYGDYVTDGLLLSQNADAIYEYETVGDETILFLGTPSPTLTVTQSNGGSLKCGNWRYAVRFVVEGSVATEWSFLTNPINVFPRGVSGDGDAQYLTGGSADTVSVKANAIQVDNIPTGVYNYVELAAIQYVGLVPVGAIAKRQRIAQNDSSTIIVHTGTTVDEVELDLTTLGQVFAKITKGKNLLLLDNRLVPSNFSVQTDYDLSEWATAITYTIERQEVDSIGYASTQAMVLGENFVPENTVDYTGYMINETYRFGVQVKWKNYGWSSPYFIADILINPDGAAGSLPDASLTNGAETLIYVPFVQFSNLDLSFVLEDGTTLADHLDLTGEPNIRFVRAECINEVLACGGLAMGDQLTTPPTYPESNFIDRAGGLYSATDGYFYSPDIYFNKAYPSSATLKFLDAYINNASGTYISTAGTIPVASTLREHSGDFTGCSFTDIAIDSITVVNVTTSRYVLITTVEARDIVLIQLNVSVPATVNTDYGFYYCQLFNAVANKYGDIENTQYITTGNAFAAQGVTTATTFDVFGGDTFTQKTYKVLTQLIQPTLPAPVPPTLEGKGLGFGYYVQSRVNGQMQIKSDEDSSFNVTLPGTYGTSTGFTGLDRWLNPFVLVLGTADEMRVNNNINLNEYNKGYNIQNLLQQYVAFTTLPQQSYFPSRIAWSELKVVNGISDAYRIILPLNFKDLPPSNGEIIHTESANRRFLTWQKRAFELQYFNSTGQLSSPDSSQILIGDGSVMSRIGDNLSLYGTEHKWGVIKGLSAGGKDVFYWLNAENKKLLRFGYDGTEVLSDSKLLQSFFANNIKFVLDYTKPVYNYGISGVYNNRFAEAIFTIRAINPSVVEFALGQVITTGNYRYGTITGFDGTPLVYKAKSSFTINSTNSPIGVNSSTYWELIDFSDNTIYNNYTIVFNEYTNRFTNFLTPKAKIYLKHRDTYLTPHPTSSNRVYEHDRGEYAEWYLETLSGTGTIVYTSLSNAVMGIGTNFFTQFPVVEGIVYYLNIGTEEYEIDEVLSVTSLTLKENVVISGTAALSYNRVNSENAYVEVAVNESADVVKGYNAIRVNSDKEPYLTDFATETHISNLTPTDYEEYEGYFESAIKNDATVSADNPTGSTEEDTSRLYGKWMKVKIYFKKRNYNKMFDFIVKFAPKSRLFNK